MITVSFPLNDCALMCVCCFASSRYFGKFTISRKLALVHKYVRLSVLVSDEAKAFLAIKPFSLAEKDCWVRLQTFQMLRVGATAV